MMDVEDKLLIQELLNLAAYGLDTHNLNQIESCFAPEATMVVNIAGGTVVGPFVGRPSIMKLMADSIEAQTDVRRHVVSNLFFDQGNGSLIGATSNLTLFAIENEKIRLVTTGIYRDRLKKINGKWCIVERQLDLDLPY